MVGLVWFQVNLSGLYGYLLDIYIYILLIGWGGGGWDNKWAARIPAGRINLGLLTFITLLSLAYSRYCGAG
jgi:hypothetical protein